MTLAPKTRLRITIMGVLLQVLALILSFVDWRLANLSFSFSGVIAWFLFAQLQSEVLKK